MGATFWDSCKGPFEILNQIGSPRYAEQSNILPTVLPVVLDNYTGRAMYGEQKKQTL